MTASRPDGADDEVSPTAPDQQWSGMYLRNFRLRNFRSCSDVTVQFQPSLTLLVGENNSGKSNVVDGLRLLTSPLSGRRSRYFELEDVSFGQSASIELTAEFDGLTRFQQGQYTSAIDINTNHAWYTTRYVPDDTRPRRSRVENLTGVVPMADPEPAKRDQINHVYLAPLRDARRELDSAAGNRLALIIKYLTAKDDRDDFLKTANAGLRHLEGHKVISETREKIQQHVSDLTDPVRGQVVGLGFQDFHLHRLARSLRLKMAEHHVALSDIAESGLGYANLVYMASVILELRNAKDSELTLFLVEEPEAHLHPQLQAVLLDYLREQAEESSKQPDDSGPAGRIQVIATTHSPNLASSVGTANIVVLRTVEQEPAAHAAPENIERGVDSLEEVAPLRRETRAIALRDINLTADERRKIDQYLDVTRAELLFTRRAILVEGIAEAVLLPVLARHCVFDNSADDYRLQCRKFHAVSVINIGSVDFSPYVKLLLQTLGGVRLVDQLVVITDGDPSLTQDQPEDLTESDDSDSDDPDPVRLNRKDQLEQLAAELSASNILTVAEARYTLEADLMEPVAVNGNVLAEAFRRQKPGAKSRTFWEQLVADPSPALVFYRKLRTYKGRYIGKGEFAHDVASLIRSGGRFQCPEYLAAAIMAAIEPLGG